MSRRFQAVSVLLLACSLAAAQATPAASGNDDERGFASYVQFGGSSNSSGRVFKLDTSIGYNFSSHVGFDVGVPVYFVSASSTATGTSSSNQGMGNPYLDFRLTFRNPVLSYRSIVTGYFPVADVKSGFSTGRMTGDWTNHFEHSFSRLTPFANLGIGNTILDSRFFDRPFTSLGFNAHVEGGASLALSQYVNAGASGYAILPSGQQRIYSRMLKMSSGGTGTGMGTGMGRGRVFDTAAETVGTADIARDHGASAWIGASPNAYLDFELGYTRSAQYDLNSVSFNVGVNIGRLVRNKSRH